MNNTTHASRLRYLDADDVDDSVIDYDGLDVKGPDGDNIGNVDGFLVDPDAARVYYVVVDSGGWFSSRSLLLPVGHARLDTEARELRVDLTRDALRYYPEFDEDRFRSFSDEELGAFERRMATACCPGEKVGATPSFYETSRHYAQPEWWPRTTSRQSSRLSAADVTTRTAVPVHDRYAEELVTAREREHGAPDAERLRDTDRAPGSDIVAESPHPDGRAQPGDVLGIETGGETTHMGDTAEDEDKRRRDAVRS